MFLLESSQCIFLLVFLLHKAISLESSCESFSCSVLSGSLEVESPVISSENVLSCVLVYHFLSEMLVK